MPAAATSPAASPRSRDRLRVSVFLLLAAMFAVLATFRAGSLWLHRDAEIADGQKRAENLALILGDHLQQTIVAIDTAMTQLALHSQRVGGPHAPAAAWRPVLEATLSGLTGVGSLTVLDDQGIITHSSIDAIVGQSRRDLYMFRRIAADPLSTMVAEAPFRSLRDGHFVIPLGRRLEAASAQFQGIVVATLEPARLRNFYRSVDVGPNGTVTVLHPEGLVLFREPSPVDPIGEPAATHPVLQAIRSGTTSGFIRQAAAPGEPVQLTAFRTLDHPPVIVAVSLDQRDVLVDWWREASLSFGVLVFVGLALLYAGYRLNREMSARAVSETALEKNREHFQEIMDHAPLEIVMKNLAGRYTLTNRAFEQRHRLSPGEGLGKTSFDLLPRESAEAGTALDRRVIETKAPGQEEIVIPFANGPRNILMVKFPLLDARGEVEGVGMIATDVTDQKQAEAQLAHAQKMEAIGQLTGGIAHDFNNLLTIILGSAEMLATRTPGDQDYVTLARLTMEAAERGAALTQRLLAFGRRQALEPRPTDVNGLIAGTEQLLQRTLGEHVAMQHLRAADLWTATVDQGQLETAIINLAVNARDAMPGGGKLTIETANVHLDDSYVAANPDVQPGDYVMVAISDTGVGMTPEVAARAFEPFFTTKEVGKGTGLGLSMVYGFIKQSGGHAKIYSEPGIGTAVKLYLPRAAGAATGADAAAAAREHLPTGGEFILLVEDNEAVRAQTEAQLRRLGYQVGVAGNAAEAFAWLRQAIKPDLLLTDVVMPGKSNGAELARKLRERWPGLKVLYMSGYTHGAIEGSVGDVPGGKYLLSKPFRLRELAAKVRQVLDERAPPARVAS